MKGRKKWARESVVCHAHSLARSDSAMLPGSGRAGAGPRRMVAGPPRDNGKSHPLSIERSSASAARKRGRRERGGARAPSVAVAVAVAVVSHTFLPLSLRRTPERFSLSLPPLPAFSGLPPSGSHVLIPESRKREQRVAAAAFAERRYWCGEIPGKFRYLPGKSSGQPTQAVKDIAGAQVDEHHQCSISLYSCVVLCYRSELAS